MTKKYRPPQSLCDLFYSFTLIALQGFGGVLAIVQYELVDKKGWLSRQEFIEEWAVAQIMPGPNVVNLSLMVGSRYFGLRGALAALAGMLCVPLIIVLMLGMAYTAFSSHPGVMGALRGMSAVAAGMIIATGLKLFTALHSNPLGKTLCVLLGLVCFICIALMHSPLPLVLLVLGLLACGIAYRKLAATDSSS